MNAHIHGQRSTQTYIGALIKYINVVQQVGVKIYIRIFYRLLETTCRFYMLLDCTVCGDRFL